MNSEFTLAVHSLVLLTHLSNKMVTSDWIARSASVHPVRARKVLSLLRKNGYIQSKEGAGGGFILARDPDDIPLDEIYRLTSPGTLKPKCPASNERCFVGAHIEAVLGSIFSDAERHLTTFLREVTIGDVLNRIKKEQVT